MDFGCRAPLPHVMLSELSNIYVETEVRGSWRKLTEANPALVSAIYAIFVCFSS